MKWPAILAILLGLFVAIGLIAANDATQIANAITGAGWGLLIVIALHTPQTFFSALGWRALMPSANRPRAASLYKLRWIREAVNALLPVAQIGGDVVRARLLAMRGVDLRAAAATGTVDLAVEMASQIVFALWGLAILFLAPGRQDSAWLLGGAALIGGIIAISFMAAQRWGLFKLVERLLARFSERPGWSALKGLTGLHDSVVALYSDPKRFWTSFGCHFVSWMLGVLETWVAMHIIGIDATLSEALVIESLGQAVRGLGFAIPGALGVQEGGYLLICAMFGISAPDALALSLIRRIRDIALGVPALVLWQRAEKHAFARRRGDSKPVAASTGDTL